MNPEDQLSSKSDFQIFHESFHQLTQALYPNELELSIVNYNSIVDECASLYLHNIEFWDETRRIINSKFFQTNFSQSKNIEYWDLDKLEYEFLKTKTKSEIKSKAVNYTEKQILDYFSNATKNSLHRRIIDPFAGTGRLLSAIVDSCVEAPDVVLVEYYYIPTLIGYLRLVKRYQSKGFDLHKILILFGDTFSHTLKGNSGVLSHNSYDLIVLNPPFTRTHYFSKKTKNELSTLFNEYRHLLTGQPGLHIYSLILCDWLLKSHGQLVAVLPLATFQSEYSKGIQQLYLNNYTILEFVISSSSISFSVESNFREILANFSKSTANPSHEVLFKIHTNLGNNQYTNINSVPQQILQDERNWSIFFKPQGLWKLKEILNSKGLLTGQDLDLKIKRGVEMYGPQFFCIPNSIWTITSENKENVILTHQDQKIKLAKKYLSKSFRKPALYKEKIKPEVHEYLLALDAPKSLSELTEYVSKFDETHLNVAKNKFHDNWYSHIHNQLTIKQPYGHLFFIDKMAITSSGIICHYSEQKITSTKNFYILTLNDRTQDKLLAAWLNSTLFLGMYLLNRREIGSSYGRMQIVDILKTELFVDLKILNSDSRSSIILQFDKLCEENIPNFPIQISSKIKYELDWAILRALGFESNVCNTILYDLYNIIETYFTELI